MNDRAQTMPILSAIAWKVTNKDVVVSMSEISGKRGFRAYGPGTCKEFPKSYTVHIDQRLEGEALVEPLRKALAAVIGGKVNEQGMLTNGKGKGNQEALNVVDSKLPNHVAGISGCGWAAVVKGEKKARGKNGVVKTVTYTGSNGVGGTCKIKPDVDFIVGNKVTKWVAVCADGREFTFAPDEEQLQRAQNQAAEIQARADATVAKLEEQLKKANDAARKAEARQAKLMAKLEAVA